MELATTLRLGSQSGRKAKRKQQLVRWDGGAEGNPSTEQIQAVNFETGFEAPHRIPRGSSPAVNFRRSIGIVALAARGGHHHAYRRSQSRPAEADDASLGDFAGTLLRHADEGTSASLRAIYERCPTADGDRFPPTLREVPR